VDSGNQSSNGVKSADVYRSMVNTSLARPPQGEIEALWWRTGDSVSFSVQVMNSSNVTLSSVNRATVWGIVYEDTHVVNTNHYVRAITSTAISSLAPGSTATYTLQTPDLTGVDWTKLHYIALVDYRPDPAIRPYDTLQAVFAQQKTRFTLEPEVITLMVDPADVTPPTATVSFKAADPVDWAAETSAAWLTITPTIGSTTVQPVVSVVTGNLNTGWQQGIITFTATSGDSFSDTLMVKAYYGLVWSTYLPGVIRDFPTLMRRTGDESVLALRNDAQLALPARSTCLADTR